MKQNQKKKINDIILKDWHPYFWIIFVGFLVYFQALFFQFVYLDDNALILNNFNFISNFSNIFAAFNQDVFYVLHSAAAYYRPLLTVSLMIDAHLGGEAPFIYHFSNIVLHLLATLLLFKLLLKLKYEKLFSFLVSLIFVVHPALSLAVAFVPGRNDSLLAVFVFLSFIHFLNFVNEKNEISYLWHILFLAVALFTKESAVALFPLIIFYLLLVKKEKIFSFNQEVLAIGWGIIGLLWFLLRHHALSTNTAPADFSAILRSIWLDSPAVIQWLGKIFFPVNLSVYPIIRDTTMVFGVIALVILISLLFLSRHKSNTNLLFGFFWFFLFLAPALIYPGPIFVGGNYVASEHRLYVPFLGLILMIHEIDWIKNPKNSKAFLATVSVILVVLSAINLTHSRVFQNRIVFWQDAVATSPHSPLAHRNLGAMYYLDNQPEKAKTEYLKALDINPMEQMAHNNLGLIYMEEGKFEKAETEYKKEIESNPIYDAVFFNYGLLLYREGRKDEAINAWNQTIEINPEYLAAYNNLALVYLEQKKISEAKYIVQHMQIRGLQISPQLMELTSGYESKLKLGN